MRSDNNGSNNGVLGNNSGTTQGDGHFDASDDGYATSIRTVTFTPQFDEPAAKPLPSQRMRQQRREEPTDFRTSTPRPMTSVDDLDIIKRAKRPPERGLGSVLFKLTGGRINTGQSAAELEHQALVRRANRTVRGVYKIAFISLKGGVGKTTAAKTVGSTFASIRGDRIVAIDANPDLGTLADRERREHHLTVRDLLADGDIRTYSDVRYYTSQGDSRLEILASEADPETSESFNEQDYLDTLRILEVHYNIVITDCGTGIMHSAMYGILDEADALVVVSPTAQDGARSAASNAQLADQARIRRSGEQVGRGDQFDAAGFVFARPRSTRGRFRSAWSASGQDVALRRSPGRRRSDRLEVVEQAHGTGISGTRRSNCRWVPGLGGQARFSIERARHRI